MSQSYKVLKPVPVRMDLETYNKFTMLTERFGMSKQNVLTSLIKSWIAEYEGRTPESFRVVRAVETTSRVDL